MVKTIVGTSNHSVEEAVRDAEQQAGEFAKANPNATVFKVETKPHGSGGAAHLITYVVPEGKPA